MVKVCSGCRKSFPEEIMYKYSPGGSKAIYECPSCHKRGISDVDYRYKARARRIRTMINNSDNEE